MCVCVFACVGGERFTDKYTQPEKVTDRKGVGKTAGGSKRKTDGDKKESLFHVRERNCFQFCSKEHD